MTAGGPEVDVRRAGDRFATPLDWLDSRHSFSFGPHHDPANTHHGLLLVHNDDRVRAGGGFETHPHRDMEIVTWVLSGALVHQDSAGHNGIIYPGLAQRMSAGSGIQHSEKNGALRRGESDVGEVVHFIQMWVLPDERGLDPGYQQREIASTELAAGLVPVASGLAKHAGEAAITINNASAGFSVARLEAGVSVELPDAPYLHVFVARGSVVSERAGVLAVGDAVRFRATGGRVTAREPAELLVWEMHAAAFE